MRELVDSITRTAAGPVEVVFYIDDDDRASLDVVPELQDVHEDVSIVAVLGPRMLMSDSYNRCAERATGDILMECCDSVLFHTVGWDAAVEAEFAKIPDRILLVFARDGIHDGRAATLPFLHRRWMETVGYFMPPYFSCDYCDTWVWEVAEMLHRIVYLPDVFIQHRHPEAGTAALDQTKIEGYARGAVDDNGGIFRAKRPEREADAAKLRTVMA
jgi:hypothetical protein